ncbi:MAG: D-2-hydroxyacid dehydrogenase [Chitinophagaceae bacterium]|nr:MAG: D-2-hydroxyacid dehydrogenase [Chitinophagaceae bacterium]
MTIYIDTPLQEKEKSFLKQHSEEEDLYFRDELGTDESCLRHLREAEIVFGNPKPDWMKEAVRAKWIQLYSTGFGDYSGIHLQAIVTNMQDYYSQPCAETMIAGILALYRKMDTFGVLKEKKTWVGYPIRRELQVLNFKKVIILGTGSIGRRIAKILSGFSSEHIFFGRTASDATLRSREELEEKIPWADIIIGCLPGTDETKGLFTNTMINRMKQTALFCNVGRGDLIADQDYLVEALVNGTIGGAVLDVTIPEPLPIDNPLWECPNTILSQHSGGGQLTEYDGIVELFIENLKSYKKGQPLKNKINFSKGY